MNRRKAFFSLLLPILSLAWLYLVWEPGQGWRFEGIEIASAPEGGEFHLTSSHGPLALSDFRGKIVLLYFGYTWCPDICPTSLTVMSFALKQLNEDQLQQVQPIFVSVDPERDSVERLRTYSTFFHPRILGATGSREQIDHAVKSYGAAYRILGKESDDSYGVDHTADIYLIDRQGRLHGAIAHGTAATAVARRIIELLRD